MPKAFLDVIAEAVHAMRDVGLVDRDHLETGLAAALKTADHKPNWVEKLLKLIGLHRPYLPKLPQLFVDLVKSPDGLSRTEIKTRLQALLPRDTAKQAVGQYLRATGYSPYGFPVRALDAGSYSRLVSGFAYRFAYGEASAIQSDEMHKAYEYQGWYKLLVRAKGADWTRVHLLYVDQVDHYRIECLELYPSGDRVTARMGLLVPAHDQITALLTDQYDESSVRQILSASIADWETSGRDIDLSLEARPANQANIVQTKNLSHMELVFSTDRVKGRYLAGSEAGDVAGYRLTLDQLTAHLLTTLQQFPKDRAGDRLSDHELRIFDEMGLFGLKPEPVKAPD